MAVRLSWAKWFEGNERWPAPGPDADVFGVKFEPCPPEAGELPPPIATACAAAVQVVETTRAHVYFMRHIIPDRMSGSDRWSVFLLLWWSLVGLIHPARDRIHAVARHLNRGGQPVTALGETAVSAHQIALEYAATHTESAYLLATGMHSPGVGVFDPAEVCRQPERRGTEHPNQLVQDTMLACLDTLLAHYRQRNHPTEITRLRTLILAEARAAAESYQESECNGQPEDESLDDNDVKILEVLAKHRPMRLVAEYIVKKANLGERTVKDKLNSLIRKGYAARPEGRNSGATIIPRGVAALAAVGRAP